MSRSVYVFFLVGLTLLTSVSSAHPSLPGRIPSIVSTLASPAPPDFELHADPTNTTLPLDKIANITILVHAVNGFTGSVVLELTQPISSDYGPTCPDLDQPRTVTPNPNATWTFSCTSGDNVVSYTLYLKGTATTSSGRLVHNVEVTLNFTPTNASSSLPSTDPFQFSIPPTYALIGVIAGAFIITLIALSSYFRRRQSMGVRTRC
jgi:hypothetical protein